MRTEQNSYGCIELDTVARGNEETFVYLCPCGKGRIVEKHENIGAEGEHCVSLECPACSGRYMLDVSEGVRKWEIREISAV